MLGHIKSKWRMNVTSVETVTSFLNNSDKMAELTQCLMEANTTQFKIF